MCKIITVIALFFFSFVSYAEWIEFKEHKIGYSASNREINFGESTAGQVFYDKNSIQREGTKLYVNQLINFDIRCKCSFSSVKYSFS